MENDKQKHWIVSVVLTVIFNMIVLKLGLAYRNSWLLAMVLAIGVGLGKELIDSFLFYIRTRGRRIPTFFLAIGLKGTGFSIGDLLVDIRGTIVGGMFAIAMNILFILTN